MHRYSITFDAPTIDEIRLRELLEREFRLARVSITRETGSGALPEESKSPSKLEKAILEILSDGQAIRRKQLQNFLGQPPNRRFLDGTLRRLIDRGEVEKVRHGVYIRAGATHPDSSKIPPLNYDAAHPARDRVLKLLSEAHSAVELRTELDVSRQRVEQIVKVLMHEGLVHRIPAPGERGQHLYLRTDIDPNKALLGRQPFLTDVRAKVLSVHSPETIHRARDVSKVRGTSHWAVVKSLKKLSAQGLLYTFKIGQHFYVGLTPRGYEHPQFDLDAPKAQPADLFEDCNKATIWFLQALSVLGPARTIDVTDTLPEGFYGAVGYKSGQVTQRLQMASLIEADSKKSGKQSRYRLTAKGSYTAAVLNRLRRPPSIADLDQRIEQRKQQRKQLRAATRHPRSGSPGQDAIVEALRTHGPLSTPDILSRMEVRFGYPRSVRIAAGQLEKRGVIRRVRGADGTLISSDNGAHIWEVVPPSHAP